MRVGCGSATIGIFAQQWQGHVDEVIVVDDHITGVLTEHQAGRFLDMKPAGIRVRGRRSTPGRYFQVAEPGLGLGRHRRHAIRSTSSRRSIRRGLAGPAPADGLDHRRACRLVRARRGPDAAAGRAMPAAVARSVERIGENCEPALLHRAVHGRRRRLAARRRHRESRAAHALGARHPDTSASFRVRTSTARVTPSLRASSRR